MAAVPALPNPDALARLVHDAADGRPPVADGRVTVLRSGPDDLAGILAFTLHHVVVGDVDEAWVGEHLTPGDMSAPVGPRFVAALAERLGRTFDNLDLVLAASGAPAPEAERLVEVEPDGAHPRVERALRYRSDVRTYRTADGDGVLVLSRGLAGRWEASFEVEPAARGRGIGRRLVSAALGLVPAGSPLFVQISPGNVASLRTVLSVDRFHPIGAEILFPPVGPATTDTIR